MEIICFMALFSVVSADNLGAHSIGGFLELFNCLRNCRFCFTPRETMQTSMNCSDLPMRSVAMHTAQLDNTIIMSSMDCHPDLAHDLFEGVVSETLTNIIVHLVKEDILSLQELNDRILTFSFSKIDKSNKPTTVPSQLRNFKIKQTAAQMWCLARFLPLMIGDMVPRDNSQWQTLLLLEDVLQYSCAPVLDREHVMMMKDIIEDFHESFRQSFPEETIKPKMHFMLHYPQQMKNFGPLIHLQTIRFEGKHNYFQELIYRTKNKINICKSLAVRHQYYQCLFNASDKFFASDTFDTTGVSTIPVCLLRDEYQRVLGRVGSDCLEVFTSTSVNIMGITYHVGDCIVRNEQRDHLTAFSNIKYFLTINGAPYLLCCKMETRDFDRHLYAYTVREMKDECELVQLSSLKEPYPLGTYQHPSRNDQSFIVMKHIIHISLDVMEKKCIFIQCGNSSKKVVYSGALLSLNFISETAKTKFGLSGNIFLQYWDKDVDDFVDLDASSMEEINEEKLMKVRVLPNHSVEVSSVITHDQERGRI
ncbi:hypothetical protein GQR58_015387 [Nymphon striatum]|nr:hypothetical protein GQR58_015387 [Nymphon striatum]